MILGLDPAFVAWLHLVATAALMGLIWFVQISHYPLLAHVPAEGFVRYAHGHLRRTTWVVGPLMLTEVATAALLLRHMPGQALVWVSVGLVMLIWVSTAVLQVPCHSRLEKGKDEAAIRRLVRTNWVRTLAWTGRVPVAILLLQHVSGS